jgi:tRNA modification GTPase
MTTDSGIIFALATPSARSALHVHRISGNGCIERLHEAIRKPDGTAVANLKPRHAHYVHIVDHSGRVLDDVVLTVYQSPSSYTGEDCAELTCHGNPLISAALQSRLRELGMVDARPGEFTHRAYLNGKLDLTRAEAIAQLVEAETWGSLHLARQGCSGNLEATVQNLRRRMIEARALLEAHIDFHEDEVGPMNWPALAAPFQSVIAELEKLRASFSRAKQIQLGLPIALLGLPNVGKSSLFNALLREDRVIVTDTAGTTRDVIKDRISIAERDFVLADTAGIRASQDHIESLGIERTHKEAQAPGVKLFVLAPDLSVSIIDQAQLLLSVPGAAAKGPCAFVLNKTDLASSSQHIQAGSDLTSIAPLRVILVNHLQVEPLQEYLVQVYDEVMGARPSAPGHTDGSESFLLSQRQLNEVEKALQHIKCAVSLVEEHGLPEIIASEAIAAEQALVNLLGRIDADEIFASIFSTFCIGK